MRVLPFVLVCLGLHVQGGMPSEWTLLKSLPSEHVPYFFHNNPEVKELCQRDDGCPYKHLLDEKGCWGYEKSCDTKHRMTNPTCPESSRGWTHTKDQQIDMFWRTADFGFIYERKNELRTYCKPHVKGGSNLECVDYLRYCQAKDIYFDFRKANLNNGNDRYREDVFKKGQIGGNCKLDAAALKGQGEHKSPLQSWFAELEHYSSLDFNPIKDGKCDVIIEKPTYFIKLDAGINMFHHFCDFVNLYASQHINNSFSTDVYIVMWDTSPMHYGDFFDLTWKAFSDHPIIPLTDFDGKRVCFKQAVFSMLARMRRGLYYNMPLVPGCWGSSLFRAFTAHVMHRLGVKQEGPMTNKVRVTLLVRSTRYRKILNHEELIWAMKNDSGLEVKMVDYNRHMPFKDQLTVTHNSDILISMHGSGLTHLLFQPNWAAVMEIYNCEDDSCYLDLARLRGLKYYTWEKKDKLTQEDEGHHPTLGAHAKFTNYAFDAEELMRIIRKAANYVRSHPEFIEASKGRHSHPHREEL